MNYIIKTAHEWLGVPFKHQGRVKQGCDCLGLIMNLGIICKNGAKLSDYDQINYSRKIDSTILQDKLDQLLIRSEELLPGAIILVALDNIPQHLAVVCEIKPNITIVHSYIQARKVVKQHLPSTWKISRIYISSLF
jgi:cell wall-associated NlpC family hydrolase